MLILPDVFLSERNQIRNELSVLDETVSTEHLNTIILDALLAEMYLTVKLEAIRDLDLSLEQIRTDDENDLHQSFEKGVSYKK